MKINLEVSNKRALTLFALFLLFIIPMVLGEILYPYEVLSEDIIVENRQNYDINQMIGFFCVFPLLAFIIYASYLFGVMRYEKPLEKV